MGNSSNHRSWQTEFRSIPADRAAQIVSHPQEPEGRSCLVRHHGQGRQTFPGRAAQPILIVSGIV